MGPWAGLFVRPAILRAAAIVALGATICGGLSACATGGPEAATSGSSTSGVSIGDGKRGGYKLDWSKPDFGGPPPGSH